MKFRTVIMSLAVVAAAIGSAKSSASKRATNFGKWIYVAPNPPYQAMCMPEYRIDQGFCDVSFTGPVCTVTPGVLSTRTAYDSFLSPSCSVPLRQP